MRTAYVAALLLAMTAPAALAADNTQVIDPAKKGPTEAVTDSVPDMTAPKGTESRPATKSVGDSVPPMQPGQAAKPATPGGTTTGTINPAKPAAKAPSGDAKMAPPSGDAKVTPPTGDAGLPPSSNRAVQ